MTSIKWLRLRDICEKILDMKYTVHIHGSTQVADNLRAAVHRADKEVDIAINLSYAKTLEGVIDLLSHEVAHVKIQSSDDNHPKFNKTWRLIRKEITNKYHDS